MKAYGRDKFMELPDGTIYCKGEPWCFEGMCVKGESLSNDWFYLGLQWIDASSSDEADDRLYEMLEHGVSYPMEKSYGRDGCFDDDEIFLVYELDDLLFLRSVVESAINHQTEGEGRPTDGGGEV